MSRQASSAPAALLSVDTPLMQQYREIKSRHPETILFFRMGDFYEMFEDDAKLAARELGLTLTSRNNGGAAEVPLAGVPVKAAADYLRRLIANGHRVAICEQVEDPRLAKGLVRREVVETVSPGAILADDWLERNRNNFLVAVAPRDGAVGLAALDLTTGEFALEVVPPDELAVALARYEAPEIVLPAGTTLPPDAGGAATAMREAWEFDPELAREDLVRTFGLASLDGLGVEATDAPALGAAGALLRYARELKPGGLPHLARPQLMRRGDVLPLDEMTRRNLELVEPLRPGAGVTVLEAIDRTLTPMGARLLRRWLLAPLADPVAISDRLTAVEVLTGDVRGRDRLRETLDGVRDLERLASRAAMGRATPRELGSLRDSIRRLPEVIGALDALEGRDRARLLERAADDLDPLNDLAEELERALVERPPAQTADGDAIRPGFDAELDELRDVRDGGKQYIASLQARERERTGIGSLKVGYNRVFGYYLEVTRTNLDLVPADYQRRQTLTGGRALRHAGTKGIRGQGAGRGRPDRRARGASCSRRCGAGSGQRSRACNAPRQRWHAWTCWAGFADLAQRERYVRPEVTDGFGLVHRRTVAIRWSSA